jgi:hypothetical protein
LKHPFVTQGIRKIDLLLNTCQSITNNLIETLWSRTMVESGCGPHFLEHKFMFFKNLVTDGWITSLWEFISEFDSTIKRVRLDSDRVLRHPNDKYVMEDICYNPIWNINQQKQFNYCRLFLQVELLSEILTADGKGVRRNIWKGLKDTGHENFAKSNYIQPRPTETAWNNWRNLLKHTYGCDDKGQLQNGTSSIN